MPGTARASAGGVCYHVLNRGNGRARVFHRSSDYAAFVELIGEACRSPSPPALLPGRERGGRWLVETLTPQ
jgi:hypothetical protein